MMITCKNCGRHFTGNFCPNCGQKAGTGRLKVKHVVDEFWHNMTHTDKGYMSLLVAMIRKPGVVIRDYIDGKRKKYFNPYTFYLVTTALLIFVTAQMFHYEDKLYNYNNTYSQYLNLHRNIIILCCLPVIAILLKLFFYTKKYNYAEWVTFVVFVYGFINFFQILINLLYFPLIKYHNDISGYGNLIGYIIFLLVLIRFIQLKKWWQLLLCIVAVVLIYYLVELVAQLIALGIWGEPVEKLIRMFKNSF